MKAGDSKTKTALKDLKTYCLHAQYITLSNLYTM